MAWLSVAHPVGSDGPFLDLNLFAAKIYPFRAMDRQEVYILFAWILSDFRQIMWKLVYIFFRRHYHSSGEHTHLQDSAKASTALNSTTPHLSTADQLGECSTSAAAARFVSLQSFPYVTRSCLKIIGSQPSAPLN